MTLRVLGLVPYPVGRVPGQRYRIEQWAPCLKLDGIEVVFSPFLSAAAMDVLYQPGHGVRKAWCALEGHLRRLRETLDLRGFDVAYLYREATFFGAGWIESLVARRLPVVFDFDDAIYLPPRNAVNSTLGWLRRPRKAEAICGLARHVTVGNEALATFARRHARAVTVIPSTIDTDRYTVPGHRRGGRPVVGWTGSHTTIPYLRTIAGALVRLRERLDYELLVIGATFEAPGLDVRCLPWRSETEPEDLGALDVGLMPLVDDEWSRGKCGMKALQYMGLGIPPVVSPVGANATIVRDGVNGFHARTEDEWVERIALLLRDPDLRGRMGAEARRTVDESFSARVQAPRLARILQAAGAS